MGRHSAPAHPADSPSAARRTRVVALVVLAAVAVVGTVFVTTRLDSPSEAAAVPPVTTTTSAPAVGCDPSLDAVVLTVAAAPAIAPAARVVAERFVADRAGLEDHCIVPTVEVRSSAEVAAAFASEEDSVTEQLPDAWLSDSLVWVQRAKSTPIGALRLEGAAPTVARTPLVLAMPEPAAEAAGWLQDPPAWSDLLAASPVEGRLVVPDPAQSAAGLGLMMTAESVLPDDEDGRRAMISFVRSVTDRVVPDDSAALGVATAGDTESLVVTTEQAVVDRNAADPTVRLVAIYPVGGSLSLEYAYAAMKFPAESSAEADEDATMQAARRFQQAVLAEAGQVVLADHGFRMADGTAAGAVSTAAGVQPDHTDTATVDENTTADRALGAWRAASLDTRMLAVLDVSGSMDEIMPGSGMRIEVAARAAEFAIGLLSDQSDVGLWEFSSELAGSTDHVERVPIGALSDPVNGVRRRDEISRVLRSLEPGGGTALYDTTLAAFRTAQAAYDPDKINSVVLLTDGTDDDPNGSIGLPQLLSELLRLSDPDRPVQVILVAVGGEPDIGALEQIAAVTDGAVYVADEPADVERVFLDAVARIDLLRY